MEHAFQYKVKNYNLPVNDKSHQVFKETIKTKYGLISTNIDLRSCLPAPVFHMWFCLILQIVKLNIRE